MAELTIALGTGLLWLLVLACFVVIAGSLLRESRATVLLAAFPLFFAFQVLLAAGLAAAGLLTGSVLAGVHVVMVIVGAIYWLRTRSRRPIPVAAAADPAAADVVGADLATADTDAVLVRQIVLSSTALVLAGLVLYTIVTPVYVWDVLAYHMPMIASYIQNGSLEAWPTQDLRQIYRVNAGELLMLNIALLARSDVWVELPNVLGFGVCLVATHRIAHLAGLAERWCYAAVALVLTAPQIIVGAGTAKNDLIFTAVLLCAFYWFLRGALARRDALVRRDDSRQAAAAIYAPFVLAGASVALAAATKVMGLNALGALGLAGIVLIATARLRIRDLVVFTSAAVILLLILAGDVYVGNAGRAAVPVGIAPGEIHFTVGPANLSQAARYYLYELSFKRLVVPQIFEHDFLHYGYAFPFLIVLGVVTAVRMLRAREFVLSALALASLILFVSIIAVRLPIRWDQRFMIWLVPVLAVLALANGRELAARYTVALVAASAALGLVNLLLMLTNEAEGIFNRSALHLVQTGEPARYIDVPLPRYPAMKDGFAVLDSVAVPRDSVLYAGADDMWMYLAWGPRFTRHVEGVWDAEHAAQQLTGRQFRFVVIEHAASIAIRDALARAAVEAGYTSLVSARSRTILVRPQPDVER
jgi:hypothetical protein